MTKPIAIALIALLCLVTGCSTNKSAQDAQAELCENLARLKTSVATLNSMNPDSTVGDLKEAQQRVRNAFEEVKTSAQTLDSDRLKTARTDELEQAHNNLDDAVNSIPDSATVSEGIASIQDEIAVMETAREQTRSAVNCTQ